MARYTEAVCRLCRREGVKLFLKGNRCHTAKCGVKKRSQPPGVHQWSRPKTEYGKQLREKQKAKRYYGILDTQFKKYYKEADRLWGDTGENLLMLLERRLDIVLKRLGFAASAAQARQVIVHRHIMVNGRIVRRPSFMVSKGDEISCSKKEKSQKLIKGNMENLQEQKVPTWLTFDEENLLCKVVSLPIKEEIPIEIQAQLIVEFSSR